jgi:hypothetical protein
MDPVRHTVPVHMKPERVVHRVGSVRPFDGIEIGLMLQMGSRQTEFPPGRFVEPVPGSDGGREAKGSIFIGTEKLLGQIDQDELLFSLFYRIEQRKRGKERESLQPLRNFDGQS